MYLTPIRMSLMVLLTALPLILGGRHALAEVAPQWTTTYVDGVDFGPRGLAVDGNGNSYVISTVEMVSNDEDIALTKFGAAGEFVWQSVYAGPIGQDLAVDVVLSADEAAVFAVGRSSVPGFGNSDYNILKYDAQSGQLLWQRFYNGPAGGIDDPRAAAATPDGGLVVTGGVWNEDERFDYGTVKYDAAGHFVWDALFGDNGPFLFNDDRGEVIAVTPAGDVVVSGTARPAASGNDVVTFKYDGRTGALLWEARYTTSADERVDDLALTPDGDVIVYGTDPFGWDRQWLVVRYDGTTGAEEWVALYDPGSDESPAAVAVDAAGDVYVTGATDPDADDGNFNENLIAISFDGETGAFRWVAEFGEEGINRADFGQDLWADNAGNLFVLGSSRSDFVVQNPFDADAIILQYDAATGALLDMGAVDTTEPDDFTRTDAFLEIGLDAAGNLYARGLSAGDVFVEPRLLLAQYALASPADPADLDGDGVVGSADLALLLGQWGSCPACAADLDSDGTVGAADLALLLGSWY